MRHGRYCAIAVMAKAPRAGSVKTRLVPPLSVDEAAALGSSFLADVTANIRAAALSAPIRGFVAFAPSGTEHLFEGIVAAGTDLVLADGSPPMPAAVGGFGRCLLHASQSLFAVGYGSVCLLNADSPNLPTRYLTRAAAALAVAGDRVVLGPATDGGYYLVGMKAAHACLFQDVAWSTALVAEQTRARAAHHGLEVVELPAWYDVDDAASLDRLVGALACRSGGEPDGLDAFPAPVTTRLIAALRLGSRLAKSEHTRSRQPNALLAG